MKSETAQELITYAQESASYFSDPSREYNYNNERYTVDKITPTSEHTALIVYRKSSGKFACQFAYYVKNKWWSFFPTDSHIEGFRQLVNMKYKIEDANFSYEVSRAREQKQKPQEDRPYIPGREYD